MKKVVYFFTSLILVVGVLLSCPKCSNSVCANSNEFSNFSSSSYLLLESKTGEVLYAHNENQKMPVASICKLMTTLLTIENIESGNLSLDDKLVASAYACEAEGSQAFLDAGSEYLVRDLLKSVIVASANDSSIVLAEHIGGSEKSFVKMMNERAKQLNMQNTLYANATGLPSSDQYSTAKDCAIILKEVSKHDIYKEDCKIWMDSLVHPSGRETELVNTNRLIRYYDNCLTGKTGFTDEAGYCLVSSAQKGDMNLTAVTLKCKDAASRFKESIELFEYGFNNFENEKVIDKNNPLELQITVKKGKVESAELMPENDFYLINKKGNSNAFDLRFEIDEYVHAPISKGDIVGKIVVLKDGVVAGEVNIVSANDIDKQNYKDVVMKIVNNWEL